MRTHLLLLLDTTHHVLAVYESLHDRKNVAEVRCENDQMFRVQQGTLETLSTSEETGGSPRPDNIERMDRGTGMTCLEAAHSRHVIQREHVSERVRREGDCEGIQG